MKRLFSNLTLIFSLLSCTLSAQINIELINSSDLIIEGKIIEQRCIETDKNDNIYTLNTIKVFKVFKGNVETSTIMLATLGGRMGKKEQTWSHGFVAVKETEGVFFLKNGNVLTDKHFIINSGEEGFLRFIDYNGIGPKVYGQKLNGANITNSVFKEIEKTTQIKHRVVSKSSYEVEIGNRNASCVEYRLTNPTLAKVITFASPDAEGFMLNFDIEIRNEEEFDYQQTEFSMEYSKNLFGEYIVNQKDIDIKLSDELQGYTFQLNDETSTKWHLSINKATSSNPLKVNNFYQKLFSASLFLKSNDLSKLLELKVDENKDLKTFKIEKGTISQISCSFFNKNISAPITNFVAPSISKIDGSTAVQVVTAGTRTLITIEGTNFLSTPTSTVLPEVWFTNAYADYQPIDKWVKPTEADYVSRTMTIIKVYVPTVGEEPITGNIGLGGYYAGTGKILVYRPSDKTSSATKKITIKYAARNNVYSNQGQPIFLAKHSESGGYTIGYTDNFKKKVDNNQPAKKFTDAFERGLQYWQCKTGLNFVVNPNIVPNSTNCEIEVDVDNTISDIAVTRFDVYYQDVCDESINNGSKNHPTTFKVDFFTKKIKILFNGNKTNFDASVGENVEKNSIHELGHAHGLYHVLNISEVMYPSGYFNTGLTTEAINASNYILDHSVKNTCYPNNKFIRYSCKTGIREFDNNLNLSFIGGENNFIINNPSALEIEGISIYDINGRIISSEELNSFTEEQVIVPNTITTSGVYIIAVQCKVGSKSFKFTHINK